MYYSNEKKPKFGEEVIFIYDDIYHIGYLISDDGSNKPRKWSWFSYIKGYEEIQDLVDVWFDIPKLQPERSKREDAVMKELLPDYPRCSCSTVMRCSEHYGDIVT